MFIGHFAIGLGAKKAAPKVSLGALFLSAQLLDLLWPTFLLLGWESVKIVPGITEATPLNFTSYPYSHSFLMVLFWGLIAGLIYWLIKRDTRSALVISACVISHWILDLIVHRPDLPLLPGYPLKVGIGLWNYVPASIVVEGIIFIAGVYLYIKTTRAKNKAGKYGLWSLVAFLVVIQVANLFGPAPQSVPAIAWAGQLQWLLVICGYWVDRNRALSISNKSQE
jgi:membrane-bound metal-dependent hydrolase YbcI (DUF457 family)